MIDISKHHKELGYAYTRICLQIELSYPARVKADFEIIEEMLSVAKIICEAYGYPYELIAEVGDTFCFGVKQPAYGSFNDAKNSLL